MAYKGDFHGIIACNFASRAMARAAFKTGQTQVQSVRVRYQQAMAKKAVSELYRRLVMLLVNGSE